MNLVLYFVAFLEGFTTLSVEIMSIRNSIAIIGSNAVATSIILGIILLALSYGYYRGGVFASNHSPAVIQRKIYQNLLIASVFYTFVSFPLESLLLTYLLGLDIGYFMPIFIGISVLFILPVFLASQTIPLLSELIHDDKKAIVIGKLLFFSTIGSFMGSVVTSLVFFSYIGVQKSIVVNGLILAILSTLIYVQFNQKYFSKKGVVFLCLYMLMLVGLLAIDFNTVINSPGRVYSHSSEYNDIDVFHDGKTRVFMMNRSNSSGIDIATGKSSFGYIQAVTDIIDQERPKKILIVGAAGFSLPQDIASRDYIEQVDVCDIDGSLDVIAEEYFLQQKLHPKIHFSKESARYFINKKIQSGEKYDFIFLDAYNGRISIPSELLTVDFFESVRQISSKTVAMNIILDNQLESIFYKKLSNTLLAAFQNVYMHPIFLEGENYYGNFLVTNSPFQDFTALTIDSEQGVYSDNLNTLEIDKYALFYSQKMN